MQLLELIDTTPTEDLPCLGDPDLFFAERPADLEQAKALCVDCPIRRSAWPRRSTAVSPGACGAGRSSTTVS